MGAQGMGALLTFAMSADAFFDELAPDIELDNVTYEGEMRRGSLEALFTIYSTSVQEASSSSLLQSMGMLEGSEGTESPEKMEQVTQDLQDQAEQQDRFLRILGSILRISERRQERLKQDG